ncbi:MAG: hypothetical protein IJU02_07330 [Lachnospiraceae bacterium]|nr:hypothetical protein [Lachnospiraceae bacterium]
MGVQAQIRWEGNTIVASPSNAHKGKMVLTKTPYTKKLSNGDVYPIYINKETGKCYLKRVSKKTGKEYNQGLSEEESKAVAAKMGIPYTYKGRKK